MGLRPPCFTSRYVIRFLEVRKGGSILPELTFEQLVALLNSADGIATSLIAGFFAIAGAITGGLMPVSLPKSEPKRSVSVTLMRNFFLQHLLQCTKETKKL